MSFAEKQVELTNDRAVVGREIVVLEYKNADNEGEDDTDDRSVPQCDMCDNVNVVV